MRMQIASVLLVLFVGAAVAPGATAPSVCRCDQPLPLTLDMAVEIARPESSEAPGLMPVAIRLTNAGDTDAFVPRLDVTIMPCGYADHIENVPSRPGQVKLEFMPQAWAYGGGTETCTAWITYPEDMNHHNDTDVVIVNPDSGQAAGVTTDVSSSPFWLSASIARTTFSVSHTEPLHVTLFDIRGRAVLSTRLGAAHEGKSSLDLDGLRSGVYIARLDDGRCTVTRKLVLQP